MVAEYLLVRPGSMHELELYALLGLEPDGVEQVSKKRIVVPALALAGLEERCTLAGIEVLPITLRGSFEEALAQPTLPHQALGDSHPFFREWRRHLRPPRRDPTGEIYVRPSKREVLVLSPDTNRADVTRVRALKENGYFGNAQLTARMLYFHEDVTGTNVDRFIDPFLGFGGGVLGGLLYGCRNVLGIEIDPTHFTKASEKVGRFAQDNGHPYSVHATNDAIVYSIEMPTGKVASVYLVLGNSLVDGPQIAKEFGFSDAPVVSDIPWGPYACNAVSKRGKVRDEVGMIAFHDELTEMVLQLDTDAVTLAQHPRGLIHLRELSRVQCVPPVPSHHIC